MSNHYHLVLRVNLEQANRLTEGQITERWGKLFNLPMLVNQYMRDEAQSAAEIAKAKETIADWRTRLTDISWFMRSLNEYQARRANEEDNCKGRFWEGRFRSQALLDDAAVLTCMSYVDLNPVRAGIAGTPEASDFTSIQQRIQRQGSQLQQNKHASDNPQPIPLMPLIKRHRDLHQNAVGFTLSDYLQLVDWAGRAVREGKRGAISEAVPPILERLGLDTSRFVEHLKGQAPTERVTVMGHVNRIKLAAQTLGRRFLKGGSEGRRLYLTGATS